jgi:hypothetical protein
MDCPECGGPIPPGQGQKREVYAGSTQGTTFSWKGGRGSSSNRRHYTMKLVCPSCATRLDAQAAANFKVMVVVGVVVVVAILIFNKCS